MYETLARIILPMLQQLNASKHGSPFVDDVDVPEHIRSTQAPPKADEYDVDGFHFDRWDWVMREMIWAFEQLQPDCDWEAQYITGELKHSWGPKDDSGCREITLSSNSTPLFSAPHMLMLLVSYEFTNTLTLTASISSAVNL